MKKILLTLLALTGILATGCEEEGYIVDWAPVNIYIEAFDSAGNSIISPEMPGMTLTFKGEVYPVIADETPTKAYLAIIDGLVAKAYKEVDGKTIYRLVFGEIDGAKDMDEDIVLDWPDGSKDVIHYHCSDHKERRTPKCKRSWKLNGKDHDGGIFSFSGKSIPVKYN